MRTHDVYFTSDQHWFHSNIIGHCNRPFLSADDMDEYMIQAWNETVKPGDVVYHLGDFAITGYSESKFKPKVEKLLRKLNGNKILIQGNHDSPAVLKAQGWGNIHKMHHVKIDGQKLILCHYAMRTWQFKGSGAIHLYGHSHGNLPSLDKSMDVGVDAMGYKPIKFERIVEIMNKVDKGPTERW